MNTTLCILFCLAPLAQEQNAPGTLAFQTTDTQANPLPCRIHLKDANNQVVKPESTLFWHDHFVTEGSIEIQVPAGRYTWEIERGPEYRPGHGTVTVTSGENATVREELKRIADLRSEGWISGDLHVHRPVEHIRPLMKAEDLNFAPVIGWWNLPNPAAQVAEETEFPFDAHRIYTTGAGEDEREGGALLYFGLRRPLNLTVQSREFPSPMHFVQRALQQNPKVWIDVEKPFWWDTPTWLASGHVHSIGIANNHMQRSGMLASEAWGKPRDTQRLPNPLGNGLWTQEIYYHILNTGFRLPPSAGSASGVLNNPVGYNRIYVHLGDKAFHRDNWFAALEQGRCFVTNGPLLRVTVNGQLPGATLGNTTQLDVQIRLTSNAPVSKVEILQNGVITKSIDGSDKVDQTLTTKLTVEPSGWILVRAITDVKHTFRFASTAPWYFQTEGEDQRISRTAAQFFLDWVNERIERVQKNVSDDEQRDAVLRWHVQAREFWRNKVQHANAP